MEPVPKAVTLRVIWRRTLQAIWRILRVWSNWQVSRKKPESSPLIVSACNRDFCRVTVVHQSSDGSGPRPGAFALANVV